MFVVHQSSRLGGHLPPAALPMFLTIILITTTSLVEANPRTDLILTTTPSTTSPSDPANNNATQSNLLITTTSTSTATNLVVVAKDNERAASQPIATRRPKPREPIQTSIQVYIVFFVGIIPAAIGATAWWVRLMRQRCRRRKIPPRSHSQGSNDGRYSHKLGSNNNNNNIPIDHIASHIARRAELSEDANNNNLNLDKDMFAYNSYYQPSQFIKSRRVYSIEIPRRNLELLEILGEGNFGQVWKAKTCQPTSRHRAMMVAVKTNKVNASTGQQEELLKELEIMAQLGSHPNVVLLLGCCTENEPYYLVLEYVPGGKLLSYLRSHRKDCTFYELDWKGSTADDSHHYGCINASGGRHPLVNTIDSRHSKMSSKSFVKPYDLINYAYQIAKGMEFISSHGIIHRDLAARNILIDPVANVCKVADFGLSRSVRDREADAYEMRNGGQMPVRWMSPEALAVGLFSTKSDVWAYGVVLWEIATLGSTPYIGMAAHEVVNFVRQGNICAQPEHCGHDLYELMKSAWAYKTDNRLTFTEIKHILAAMMLAMKDRTNAGYIDLEHFDDSVYYFKATDSCKDEKL